MGRPPLRLGRPKGRPQAPFQPSHENRYPFTNWSTFAPPKWSKFTPPLTIREAFELYLDESAPGYVERRDPSLDNVLRWIREAGGISSWAHPARAIREAERSAQDLFQGLRAKGLNAIEVYHGDHTPEEMAQFRSAAETLGLGITGGSDFHGAEKGRAQLGALNLPSSLLEALRAHSRRVHDPLRSPH